MNLAGVKTIIDEMIAERMSEMAADMMDDADVERTVQNEIEALEVAIAAVEKYIERQKSQPYEEWIEGYKVLDISHISKGEWISGDTAKAYTIRAKTPEGWQDVVIKTTDRDHIKGIQKRFTFYGADVR